MVVVDIVLVEAGKAVQDSFRFAHFGEDVVSIYIVPGKNRRKRWVLAVVARDDLINALFHVL